jgi:hypothetical protein
MFNSLILPQFSLSGADSINTLTKVKLRILSPPFNRIFIFITGLFNYFKKVFFIINIISFQTGLQTRTDITFFTLTDKIRFLFSL